MDADSLDDSGDNIAKESRWSMTKEFLISKTSKASAFIDLCIHAHRAWATRESLKKRNLSLTLTVALRFEPGAAASEPVSV